MQKAILLAFLTTTRSWPLSAPGTVKAKDDYEEALGEQIILKMMELEPCTRDMLGLTSLRSPRFATVSIISEGFNVELFPFLSKSVCSSGRACAGRPFTTDRGFMATKVSPAYEKHELP
jgi:hypothetical protein